MTTERTQAQRRFDLFDLGGRASRIEVATLFPAWAVWLLIREGLVQTGQWGLILVVGITLSIALLLASVRRLHDLGRTGWWSLLGFVPFLNFALFLGLSVIPGKATPNRFGPPPI